MGFNFDLHLNFCLQNTSFMDIMGSKVVISCTFSGIDLHFN